MSQPASTKSAAPMSARGIVGVLAALLLAAAIVLVTLGLLRSNDGDGSSSAPGGESAAGPSVTTTIYLLHDVSESDRAAIESKLDALKSDGVIVGYEYGSQDEAYERFKKEFAAQPEVVQNTPKEAISASFRTESKDAEAAGEVESAFVEQPGPQPTYAAGIDRIKVHTSELSDSASAAPDEPATATDTRTSGMNGLTIAGIACAVVAGVLCLMLVIRRPKKQVEP